MQPNQILDCIVELLDRLGVKKVCEVTGVSARTFYNWRGRVSEPTPTQLLALVDADNSTLWDLFSEPSSQPSIPQRHQDLKRALHNLEQVGVERCETLASNQLMNDPVFRQAIDWYTRYGGKIREGGREFEFLSTISLIQSIAPNGLSMYLHCGHGSVAAAYYGLKFAENPNGNRDQQDDVLEAWAAKYYRAVLNEKKLVFHDIATKCVAQGQRLWLQYRRICLPVEVPEGNAVLVIARENAPSIPLGAERRPGKGDQHTPQE